MILQGRCRHGTSVKGTLVNMLRGQPDPWQTQGCSDVPDPTIHRALTHQGNTDLAAGSASCYAATGAIPFHPQRVGRKSGDELSRYSNDAAGGLMRNLGGSRVCGASFGKCSMLRHGRAMLRMDAHEMTTFHYFQHKVVIPCAVQKFVLHKFLHCRHGIPRSVLPFHPPGSVRHS